MRRAASDHGASAARGTDDSAGRRNIRPCDAARPEEASLPDASSIERVGLSGRWLR
jgi:hypothetical protein